MINANQARENLKIDRAIRLSEAIKQASKNVETASCQGKRSAYVYNVGKDIIKDLMNHVTRHGFEAEYHHESDVRSQTGDYLKISW